MLIDEVLVNVQTSPGPAWWITAIVATGSAVIGSILSFVGQRIEAGRRVKQQAIDRSVENRREDFRQWDERIVRLASGIVSAASNVSEMDPESWSGR